MQYHLTVNGIPVVVEAQPDTPLLWVLRDTLKLHGTKYGCGIGECAACTVHINGAAQRACQMPVSAVTNAAVTTIEGLSDTGTHPVQTAWHEIDVPQCGYCQPGQIMAAAALLAETPSPTDAQIDEAMSGNLCRCGTYIRIRAAVHKAAQLSPQHSVKPAAASAAVAAGKAK